MTHLKWLCDSISENNGTWMERIKPIVELLEKIGTNISTMTYQDARELLFKHGHLKLAPGTIVVATKPLATWQALVLEAIQADEGRHLVLLDLNDSYLPDTKNREVRRDSFAQISCRSAAITDYFGTAIAATPELARHISEVTRANVLEIFDPPPARMASAARQDFWASRCVNVTWFGVSQNPYFRAGIKVLCDHLPALRELFTLLWSSGRIPQFNVLTNPAGLSTRAIDLLRSELSNVCITSWSRSSMEELLAETHIVFLPRGNDLFHFSKGLNRTYTALNHGCLVLTAGSKSEIAMAREFSAVFESPREVCREIVEGNPEALIENSRNEMQKLRRLTRLQIDEAIELLQANQSRTVVHPSLKLLFVGNLPIDVVKLARVLGWIIIGRESSRNVSLDLVLSDVEFESSVLSCRMVKTHHSQRLELRQQAQIDNLVGLETLLSQRFERSSHLVVDIERALELLVLNFLSKEAPEVLLAGETVGITRVSSLCEAIQKQMEYALESDEPGPQLFVARKSVER